MYFLKTYILSRKSKYFGEIYILSPNLYIYILSTEIYILSENPYTFSKSTVLSQNLYTFQKICLLQWNFHTSLKSIYFLKIYISCCLKIYILSSFSERSWNYHDWLHLSHWTYLSHWFSPIHWSHLTNWSHLSRNWSLLTHLFHWSQLTHVSYLCHWSLLTHLSHWLHLTHLSHWSYLTGLSHWFHLTYLTHWCHPSHCFIFIYILKNLKSSSLDTILLRKTIKIIYRMYLKNLFTIHNIVWSVTQVSQLKRGQWHR